MRTPPREAPSPSGRVLAFRARTPSREAQVVQALAGLASREPAAADVLYDLVNRSVYRMVLAITVDEATAERATVATFVEIWQLASRRPLAAGTAWVLDVACRCARATLAGDRHAARPLRLVPPV